MLTSPQLSLVALLGQWGSHLWKADSRCIFCYVSQLGASWYQSASFSLIDLGASRCRYAKLYWSARPGLEAQVASICSCCRSIDPNHHSANSICFSWQVCAAWISWDWRLGSYLATQVSCLQRLTTLTQSAGVFWPATLWFPYRWEKYLFHACPRKLAVTRYQHAKNFYFAAVEIARLLAFPSSTWVYGRNLFSTPWRKAKYASWVGLLSSSCVLQVLRQHWVYCFATVSFQGRTEPFFAF